ncbi:MAG: 2-C-methyl-D-erythritol 4-phosphate cytidylyltransferase [Planctomycetes bacterium]|nr:2-C-methyl-D-erythritol 4-phosphate cytidylyltransferase [Planctomycetota bacterium]
MKIAVIVPAAGESTRFGSKDKLAEDIGGRPLLLRTVEFFTKREDIAEIIVVGPKKSMDIFNDRFGPALSFHGVNIVSGGTTRAESVKNALETLSPDCDLVVVHDAARPAITNQLLDRVLLASKEFSAVAAALPIQGTLKRVDKTPTSVADKDAIADSILGDASQTKVEGFRIIETVDRMSMWEMQTPQCFHATIFQRAYDADGISSCTDDAQVVEKFGDPVHVVAGDSRNIKVTTQADLQLMKAILGVKGATEKPAHKRF